MQVPLLRETHKVIRPCCYQSRCILW